MASVYKRGGRTVYSMEYKDQHGVTRTNVRTGMTDLQLDEHCRLLEEQGVRLRRLITSLLDLSRIEQGMEGMEKRPVPVAGVAKRAAEAAPPPAGASLQLSVPEGLTVLGDGIRVEQVLVNLLTNAWRYGGPAVTLEAVESHEDVLLVVGDSVSAGYGLSNGQGWVELLGKKVAADGYRYRVVNASITGGTTAGDVRACLRHLRSTSPRS